MPAPVGDLADTGAATLKSNQQAIGHFGHARGKIRAAILVYPEVTASVVYTMHDLLFAAGRDWSFITTGVPGRQRIAPYVVSADKHEVQSGNGVWIKPDYDFGDCPRPDIVCVPDFPLPADDPCIGRFDTEVAWPRQITVYPWKEPPELKARTINRVRSFLKANKPGGGDALSCGVDMPRAAEASSAAFD